MNHRELRRTFLEFFAQRDRKIVPSSSLIPKDGPSLVFAGAGKVKLRVPSGAVPPPLPQPEGVLVAEAELKPNEIQDLAEVVGETTKPAAGKELKFKLRIEPSGETKRRMIWPRRPTGFWRKSRTACSLSCRRP